MKAVAPLFAAFFLLPLAAAAQEEPPTGFAEVERARSMSCVGNLARMEDLDRRLEPFARRMDRLRLLGQAISLEDTTVAAPFAMTDSVESAVARWFAADEALAQRVVAGGGEAVQQERAAAREQILETVRGYMASVNNEAQEELKGSDEVETAAAPCQGAILVRPAVLEACAAVPNSSVCETAKATEPQQGIRFVDAAEDLWSIEDFRPWGDPGRLRANPDGSIAGGRTAAMARRGNIVVMVALAPMIRARSELSPEDVAEFEANLDSLGFTFDHPDFVMAPALEVQASLPGAMAGETHYLLHFGDLTGDDVIWSAEVGPAGVMQATFPASGANLARLQAGEMVSLTAVKILDPADPQADAVYTIPLLQVNQARAVGNLLQYMGGGDLGRDLAQIVPPSVGSGGGH